MSIAERLAAAIRDSGAVTMDALGTTSELRLEAPALAASPQAPAVAAAFCRQLQSGMWTEDHQAALLGFVAGLAQQRSYLALREAADILLDDQQALPAARHSTTYCFPALKSSLPAHSLRVCGSTSP